MLVILLLLLPVPTHSDAGGGDANFSVHFFHFYRFASIASIKMSYEDNWDRTHTANMVISIPVFIVKEW